VGRLFWKFFLSILFAQVAATVGIGGAVWLTERARQQQQPLDIDTSPPAQMAIDSAASTLEYGGTEALRSLLASMERHRVFAVDESGRDLLGRIVKPVMLVEARYVLAHADQRRVVREMTAKDGHRYLLFLPSAEHLRGLDSGAGPGGPGGPGGAVDAFGIALAVSGPSVVPPLLDKALPSRGRPGEVDTGERGSRQRPREMGGMGMGPPDGRTEGGLPLDMRERGMWRGPFDAGTRAVFLIVAATLASLLFAFLLAWYFSRPIRDLRLAFEAASNGDLAPRFSNVSARRGDELSELRRDFDRMTGRLRSLMDGQTRLLHDVSHELRSPLARLQAAIGLAHQQPEKLEASMARIERESVRMDKLVGELLTLSRLEAGALHTTKEEIHVADLIADIVGDANFEASAQGRNILVDGEPDSLVLSRVLVMGQADLLARAIENVVRNAIKHSPAGGTVLVELSLQPLAAPPADGQQFCIKVLDRGPGVDATALQAIFQPFFRAETTQHSTEGHGLGLAIAQHVIEAHHGTISASNRTGGGLCVEMRLPVAQSLEVGIA
jgi:two-component system OmpR family sensor kinase